jgi:predicted transposase YdaD
LTEAEHKSRHQAYDETIKNIQIKDFKGLASIVLSEIDEAEEIVLNTYELPMTDMKKPDYVAKIKLHGEYFLLHMEFESSFRSNIDMQRRMLRYYSNLCWNEELPILQAVVLLKESGVKNISNGLNSSIFGKEVLKHHYEVIKLYEMDKYEILKSKATALYPLRVFMKHRGESPIEHLKECFAAAETINDPDFYFLTVQCGGRLYGEEMLKIIVKEAIYMASALYLNPYEKGKMEGKIEGKLEGKSEGKLEGKLEGKTEGKLEGKTDLILRQLFKKFGIVPLDIKDKIGEAEQYQLDLIAEGIFDFQSIDDTRKYLQ